MSDNESQWNKIVARSLIKRHPLACLSWLSPWDFYCWITGKNDNILPYCGKGSFLSPSTSSIILSCHWFHCHIRKYYRLRERRRCVCAFPLNITISWRSSTNSETELHWEEGPWRQRTNDPNDRASQSEKTSLRTTFNPFVSRLSVRWRCLTKHHHLAFSDEKIPVMWVAS